MAAMSDPTPILIIDDEEAICYAFQRYFEARGCRVTVAPTGRAGLAAYRRDPADVVFLDVRLPDADGLAVLDDLRREDPDVCVVIITAYGSLETVTRAVRGKAFDYLAKPLDLDRAAETLENALASRKARRPAAPPAAEAPANGVTLVGRSAAIQEVYKRIGLVAQSDAAVLLLGETGTGKEVVARAIHEHGRRKGRPFIALNGGALPDTLVESELFGYARGAFTGADSTKPGRFEAADGGTLFLDEVGELPLAAQVKLLRFFDTRTIERLGSVHPIALDVRILAATNRDLQQAVATGQFRQDLYFRLAVIQIELPRLADRGDDILLLAGHFLAILSRGRAPAPVTPEAAEVLRAYPWPGNVRELRNAMEHAAVVASGGPILPFHLPEAVRRGAEAAGSPQAGDLDSILADYVKALPPGDAGLCRTAVEHLERFLIRRALRETGGNMSAAADRLGLHRNTLRNKIAELGIET